MPVFVIAVSSVINLCLVIIVVFLAILIVDEYLCDREEFVMHHMQVCHIII